MGYHRAGFDVVGVDIEPQPRYPFPFIQTEAIQYTREHGHEFDAIHASPPCQAYSRALRHRANNQPMLIDAVREVLNEQDNPWIIENVDGAPLTTASDLFGNHGTILCGTMFGLWVWRHRLFECSFHVPPLRCRHDLVPHPLNPYNSKARERDGVKEGSMKTYGYAMGIGWMKTDEEISNAIPPAYTEYLGRQLLLYMEEAA